MKEYKYGNVTVRVHGKPDQEKLKKAVEEFAKSNYEYLYPEQKEKGLLGPQFLFSNKISYQHDENLTNLIFGSFAQDLLISSIYDIICSFFVDQSPVFVESDNIHHIDHSFHKGGCKFRE